MLLPVSALASHLPLPKFLVASAVLIWLVHVVSIDSMGTLATLSTLLQGPCRVEDLPRPCPRAPWSWVDDCRTEAPSLGWYPVAMAVASRLPRRLYALLRHGGVRLWPWKDELFALAERPQCRDVVILELLGKACQPWGPSNHHLFGAVQVRERIVELYWFLRYQGYQLPPELVFVTVNFSLILM